MSQPYAKNMSVEYAQKAIPGSELQKSIDNALNAVAIPVLTEDTALEIFANKPKFIIYSDTIYVIRDLSEYPGNIYYVTVYENYATGLVIANDGTITYEETELAVPSDIKPIYYHPISIFNNVGRGFLSFAIIDNSPTAYTKETLISKLADFSRISPLSGAIVNNSKTLVAGYGWLSAGKHYILGLNTDGTAVSGVDAANALEDFINLESTTIADGVNRIN